MNAHVQLALLHALLLAPFLIYVGLAREQVPDAIFTTLLGLGIVILGYHSYKAYTKLQEGKSPWVNYIHMFLLAPLLIILGYNGKTANRKYFEMLLLLGFAAFGYHSLTLVREFSQ
jgi:ABC-type transport system involved in cytochrome c biogenesis permease subunit